MTLQDTDRSTLLARSLDEIRRLRGELAEVRGQRTEPIAIVGGSCRMPGGADSPEAFWQMLVEGRDAITEVPPERLGGEPPAEPRFAGLIDDVAGFDAKFFGISAREAASLDPQQRLLLEVSWEALERAAQAPDELAGSRTGVFFGITNSDYSQRTLQHIPVDELGAHVLTSNASTFAAGRLSYWLGLSGPALSVDTACSSSLVALHLACESLRSGESDLALAGGVNVLLSPEWFAVLPKAQMLASDGRCKTFAAGADGYVRSEGCGVLVVRRLSDALERHDRILAVVRGSAVNQDGRSSGITVPNPTAQREVIRAALANGGVDPAHIGYVEAHGTGTPLGDPIELASLHAALGGEARGGDPVRVGSVKTNVGHLEPAAGMAGVMKIIGAFRHQVIPPHLNLDEVNGEIQLEALGMEVPTEVTAWPANGHPRFAGVSSFGASGTNAHVVLEEPPEALVDAEAQPGSGPGGPQLLTFSARTATALDALTRRYRDLLRGTGDTLADLAYTAGTGRQHLQHRLAVVADDVTGAAAALDAALTDGDGPGVVRGVARRRPARGAAFLFSGQGAQRAGMARGLLAAEPVFAEAIDRCDVLLRERGGPSVRALITDDAAGAAIDETVNAQPALVAVGHALAELWASWGVVPAAVLGHSVGELTALSVAGGLRIDDALWLAARRGALMQETAPGAMAAVLGPRDVVEAHLAHEPGVALAAVNGPESLVLSGAPAALDRVRAALTRAGVKSKPLAVTRAFHSPLLDPVLDAFEAAAGAVEFLPTRLPLASNLDGELLPPGTVLDAAYLRCHARQPVQFRAGVDALVAAGHGAFLEIGPTPALTGMARAFAGAEDRVFVPSLRPAGDDRASLLAAAATLHVHGTRVDVAAMHRRGARKRVLIPTYPFEHERHWLDTTAPRVAGSASSVAAPDVPGAPGLAGERLASPLASVQYAGVLSADEHPCLGDCVMDGRPVVNIGVYLEAALEAHLDLHGPGPVTFRDVAVHRSLILPTGETRSTQLVLDPEPAGGHRFAYHAEQDEGWTLHTRGVLAASTPDPQPHPLPDLGPGLDGNAFYARMAERGLRLGASARWVEEVAAADGACAARMRAAAPGEADGYVLHPGLTDAMFQALFACLPEGAPDEAAYLIVGIDRFVVDGLDPSVEHVCHGELLPTPDPEAMLLARVRVLDPDGRAAVLADGVTLRRAADPTTAGAGPARRAASAPAEAAPVGPVDPDDVPAIVRATIASALGEAPAGIDPDEPLQGLGLDSLMALEVKEGLARRLGVTVPLVSLLDGHTTTELVADVLGLLGAAGAAPAPAPPAVQAVPDPGRANEPFALTDLQQAYLVGRSDAFELGGVATSFFVEVDLGGVDVPRLERAFGALVDRHDMLRAVVTPDGRQQVLPATPAYRFGREDVSDRGGPAREARLEAIRAEVRDQVRDPGRWPLFEIRATALAAGRTRLHISVDALIMDAWSTSLLFDEWAKVYRDEPLAPLTLGYRDYVLAAEAERESPQRDAALAYWRERITTLPPAPELPLAVSPASVGAPRFGHRSLTIDPERWGRIKARATEAGVTASAAICTAYAQVLATWCRSPRFTLNVLFFNRLPVHPEVERIVGNFSTTTLLEVDATPGIGFAERARATQRQLLEDLDHRHVSGVEVLRELNRVHGAGHRASMPVVFASTVSFANKADSPAVGLTSHLLGLGTDGEQVDSSIRTPQVWLDHQIVEDDGALVVNWDVVEELFPAGMVDAMFSAYAGLVDALADDPAAWGAGSAPLVPESELAERALANATHAPRPAAPRLLHEAVAAQARARPDAPAVLGEGPAVTFAQLDGVATRLARGLQERGVGPGTLVPVVMAKGWEQIAAVLAVGKAGGAYVPIDAAVPAARLAVLCGASDASVALTQPGLLTALDWPVGVAPVAVDDAPDDPAARPLAPSRATPDDLAYVIFTSGSTGTPKGVMIEHRAALNTIDDVNARYAVTAEDRVLALSALNFDLSVWDVFGVLGAGGAVVLPPPDALREPARWAALVEAHGVTLWNSVPALMEMFAEHLLAAGATADGLRVVMMSGDWIPLGLPDRIRAAAPRASLHSLGGATEAAIWSIEHPIGGAEPGWTSVPYGRPMENQRFHVLSKALQPCPTWATGDLFIAGDGLARGYLGDAARTRASFFRHPLTGERLYRTGDLGRYRPGGVIEFLGREDTQVKVQGFRIELGEVEVALLARPEVRAAVAAAVGDRAARRLVGYVVLQDAAAGEEADALAAVEAGLRASLPDYLVPSALVALPELPLSANGKVDRGRLPDPGAVTAAAGEDVTEPRDEHEARLQRCWAAVFETDAGLVPITRSFFELGGTSLLAVRLMALVRAEFGVELPLVALFEAPTVARLAERLGEQGGGDVTRHVIVPIRDGDAPLAAVHPVGGDVLCYAPLAAALGGDEAILGVQSPAGDEALGLTELAERYVDRLSGAHPSQAYRLLGWSMGGVLALEMARILRERRRTVPLVAVVDLLEPPGAAAGRTIADAELLTWFARDLAGLSGQAAPGGWAPDGTVAEALEELRLRSRAVGVLPPELELRDLEAIYARFARNFRALLAHRPAPYDGPVRFYRATGGASPETVAAWLELLPAAEVVDLEGDHYSVMREPRLGTLAHDLRAALDGAHDHPITTPRSTA